LYKAELIHRPAPLEITCGVQLPPLDRVAWLIHHRLPESLGYIPPAEAAGNYYAQLSSQAVPT
jgi:hypothetical protein